MNMGLFSTATLCSTPPSFFAQTILRIFRGIGLTCARFLEPGLCKFWLVGNVRKTHLKCLGKNAVRNR